MLAKATITIFGHQQNSSSMQQDAHEALVKMFHAIHNITIFSKVDDINISLQLSLPLSQLTTSAIKTTSMVLKNT